ncbi:ImmA/IrrE family metallo-endopeptidase [Corynebacteriaceae bacterium 6-324]
MLLWKAAREKATDIRAGFGNAPLSFDDLLHIAGIFGATVHIRPLKPEYSGVIIKEQNSPADIYINASEPVTRQRFTLAHEIGHLVERTDVANDEDFSFVDTRAEDKYDLHEFFADEFAGALLMPERALIQEVQAQGEYGAAEHFGVSISAVRRRLNRVTQNPSETRIDR